MKLSPGIIEKASLATITVARMSKICLRSFTRRLRVGFVPPSGAALSHVRAAR